MIAIVDYGLGNTLAFANIYKRLNIEAAICKMPDQLLQATKIVLPGVGSFDWAMTKLNQSGMREVLDLLVLEKSVPVIGVCVGMQMMANASEEGCEKGLGWIDATVKGFDLSQFTQATHLPHMGWNDVVPVKKDPLMNGLEIGSRFYFLHSYYFDHHHENQVLAESDYGYKFTSAIHKDNIYGVQFHPEKSHQWGIALLKNFAESC